MPGFSDPYLPIGGQARLAAHRAGQGKREPARSGSLQSPAGTGRGAGRLYQRL